MEKTSRRRVLSTVGVLLLCGCGGQPSQPTTSSPPSSDSGSTTSGTTDVPDVLSLDHDEPYNRSDDDFHVELSIIDARRTVEHLENPELRNIAYDDSHTFLFVGVRVSNDPPPTEAFRLLADGDTVRPTDRLGGASVSEIVMANDFEQPYTENDSGGILAFDVPVASAEYSNVHLEMDDGDVPVRWTLPSDVIEDVNSRPEIRVENWETPDRIETNEPFDSALLVSNSSDDDGMFHARIKPVHTDQAETIVEEGIEPNSEKEITIELTYPPNTFVTPPSGSDTVTYSLHWKNERLQREITLSEQG